MESKKINSTHPWPGKGSLHDILVNLYNIEE